MGMPGPSGVVASSSFLGQRPLAAIIQAFSGSSTLPRPWTPPVVETPNSFRSWHSGQYLGLPGLGPDYEPAPYKDVDVLETRGRSLKSSSRERAPTRDRRVQFADAGRRRSISEPAKKQRKTLELHVPAMAANTSPISVNPLRTASTSQGQGCTSLYDSASPESNLMSSPTTSASPSQNSKQESIYDLVTALEEVLKEGQALEPPRQKMVDSPAMITLRRARQANPHVRRQTLYLKMSAAATAMTFTEVHVSPASVGAVASRTMTASPGGERRRSTTSQIVWSRDSIYEVVWEDTPNAESLRADAYNSSSISADEPSGHPDLRVYNAAPRRRHGGHQISTKLAAWSWKGSTEESSPQDSNKKQGKVRFLPLPDEEAGWMPGTLLREDGELVAPHNSINRAVSTVSESPATSAEFSVNPSRTASVDPISASATPPHSEDFTGRHRSSTPSFTFVPACVSDKSKTGHAVGASGSQRKMLLDKRTLSNLSSEERRFEDHRDSVALAQTRIFGDLNMFQEPRRFRDSIAIARLRFQQGGRHKQKQAKEDAPAHRQSMLSPIPDMSPPNNRGNVIPSPVAALGSSVAAGEDLPARHIRFLSLDRGDKEEWVHGLREAHEGSIMPSADVNEKLSVD